MALAPTAVQRPHAAAPQRGFFGHPAGLSTLFFTEMWERFSFYGMRAFLVLYMTAATSLGGMGLDAAVAAPIYGMYTSLVYLTNVPGGWIADRLIGQRRAVLYGAVIIACGHFSLAVPATGTFYLGLLLIVLGTGLLKPNISVMVGQLYGGVDARRDAAFSIFYMGINLGAFIGPLITGFLAQSDSFRALLAGWGFDPNSAWHWGFGAAGVGMTLGIAQYIAGSRRLGSVGLEPVVGGTDQRYRKRAWMSIAAGLIVVLALGAAIATGALPVTAQRVTSAYSFLLIVITIAFFTGLFVAGQWTRAERSRLYLIVVLFIAAALFWSVFEQAGSTLNLFADRSTDNSVFGHAFPSSWWQSVNALLIFVLAPVFAWAWVKLGDRQPASPTKFALGLIGVGLGFLVLVPAAQIAASGAKVGLSWLFSVYLLHTLAELCLSPVGLSAMTKLAPPKITSLMMGVWFLAASVGDFAAGQAAAFYESMPLPRLLASVAVLPILAGVVMFALRRPLIRLMKDTE